MEKLLQQIYGRPRFSKVAHVDMRIEAKDQILSIIPTMLSDFPKEILASIYLFPYKLKDMWKNNDIILINGQEFNGDFIPITVLEGPNGFDFWSSSGSLLCILSVSIKFKIKPFEVIYPSGVYPRNINVVYDSIELSYKAFLGQIPPDCYEFSFSEASYPENWQVCNGCFKPYDINELDFSDKFYAGQCHRDTFEERKKVFMRYFGSGIHAMCPHCGQQNRKFDDNHFRTLEDYNEFWKKS